MAVVVRTESEARIDPTAATRAERAAFSPPEQAVDDASDLHRAESERRALTTMPLNIRHVRLFDLPGLRDLDLLYRLHQPDMQLMAYSPLRSGFAAAVPGGRRPAFVARAGDRVVGFAQFQPKDPDQRWILIALGATGGVLEADHVIEALLEHGVQSAGLRGVKRLYARLPRGYELGEVFRRQGWTPYAGELILRGQGEVPAAGRGNLLRPQEQADTWAIHQLYNAAVPKPVQDAEALTSHHWDLQPVRRGRLSVAVSGWLIEDGHRVIAYARLSASGRSTVLELLHHPERIDVLPVLIDSALDIAGRGPGRRVFCAVRGYQAEMATALEARGFVPMFEQDLYVRYTTATMRLPVIETVPFQLEVREKIPQRVPTFLQGSSGDGAAS